MNKLPAQQRETPRWVKVVAAAFIVVLGLFAVLHVTGNTLGRSLHGPVQQGRQ